MQKEIVIAHAVASLHPSCGGPSRTVVSLADALSRVDGFRIALLSQGAVGERATPSVRDEVVRIVAESRSPILLPLGVPLRSAFREFRVGSRPAIVHSHGIWQLANHWVVRGAMRHQIPLVVQPRGMLSHWAIRHKRWKKALAMKAFQRSDLEGATLFFATSHQECDDIRALGFSQPIAVIPNGVVMPICSSRQFETQGGLRKALFLSRIHPTKGLGNLVEAWARLRPAGWQLIIAGPDEGGHRREVALAAHRLGVSDAIQWVGEIDGDKKSELYRSADFFVLPTFSENFGVVVAEALAHGLPVITTRGAPWADLDTYDCGWWIDVGVEPLVNALRSAIALSDEQLREMGARGREYVRRYDWEDIARRTTEVYWWILGQGRRPDCVRLD